MSAILARAGVAVLMILGFAVVPSSYAGEGTEVTSPADGSTVLTGFDTFEVRLASEASGVYHLLVFGCNDSLDYMEWQDFTHDGVDQTYTLVFPALTCPDYDYSANLFRGSSAEGGAEFVVGSDFTVREPAPAPEVKRFRVSPEEFWPIVKDGYKDSMTVDWESKRQDKAQIDILNSDGRIVASKRGWIGVWEWRGKTDRGTLAKPGTYRIRMTVTNDDDVSISEVEQVKIRHGMMPGTMTYHHRGTATDRRAKAGNCFIRTYSGSLTLDCWGGKFAQVDYIYPVPRNAHDFKWRLYGTINCCDRGVFSRTGTRISPTKYRIRVRVTSWRSVTLDSVWFRYSAKMMFRPQTKLGRDIERTQPLLSGVDR